MGYRSDVHMSMDADSLRLFEDAYYERVKDKDCDSSFIFEVKETGEHGDGISCKFCPHWIDESDDGVQFGWNDVKWYESFPEIAAFMDVFSDLCDDPRFKAQFARLGEDFDDWEDRQSEAFWNAGLPTVYLERRMVAE